MSSKWIIRSNTSVHASTGAAPGDRGPMVVGIAFDCAATHLVRFALLIPHFLVTVLFILGNLSISLGYNHSSVFMFSSLWIVPVTYVKQVDNQKQHFGSCF